MTLLTRKQRVRFQILTCISAKTFARIYLARVFLVLSLYAQMDNIVMHFYFGWKYMTELTLFTLDFWFRIWMFAPLVTYKVILIVSCVVTFWTMNSITVIHGCFLWYLLFLTENVSFISFRKVKVFGGNTSIFHFQTKLFWRSLYHNSSHVASTLIDTFVLWNSSNLGSKRPLTYSISYLEFYILINCPNSDQMQTVEK